MVNLLQDLQKKLEVEAEKDEEVDKKMKCWCKDWLGRVAGGCVLGERKVTA